MSNTCSLVGGNYFIRSIAQYGLNYVSNSILTFDKKIEKFIESCGVGLTSKVMFLVSTNVYMLSDFVPFFDNGFDLTIKSFP